MTQGLSEEEFNRYQSHPDNSTISAAGQGQELNMQSNPLSAFQRFSMGFGTKDANAQLLKKMGYQVLSNDPDSIVVKKGDNTYNLTHPQVEDGRSFLQKYTDPNTWRRVMGPVSEGGTDMAGSVGPALPKIGGMLGTGASEASQLIPGAGLIGSGLKIATGAGLGGLGAGAGAAAGEMLRQNIGQGLMRNQGIQQNPDYGEILNQAKQQGAGGAIAGAVSPVLGALTSGSRSLLGATSGVGGADLKAIQENPQEFARLQGLFPKGNQGPLSQELNKVGTQSSQALDALGKKASDDYSAVNIADVQKRNPQALFSRDDLTSEIENKLKDYGLKVSPEYQSSMQGVAPEVSSRIQDLLKKQGVQPDSYNLQSNSPFIKTGSKNLSQGEVNKVEQFFNELKQGPQTMGLQDLADLREKAWGNALDSSSEKAISQGASKPSDAYQSLWKDIIGSPQSTDELGNAIPGSGLRGRITSVPEMADRDNIYSNRKNIINNLWNNLSDKNSENFLKGIMGGNDVFHRDMMQQLQNESGGLNTLDNLNNLRIASNASQWTRFHPMVDMAMSGMAGSLGTHEVGAAGGAAIGGATFAAMSPRIVSLLYRNLGSVQGATKDLITKLGVTPNFVRMVAVDPAFQRMAVAGLKNFNNSITPGTTNDSARHQE